MTIQETKHAGLLASDRVALLSMALLLISPIIFKVQLTANLIVHPFRSCWLQDGRIPRLSEYPLLSLSREYPQAEA